MTSQTIDSETLLECPKIPVGGRLKFFVDRWESITDDSWVLETIQNGLKFEFISHPIYSEIRKTTVHAQNRDIFTDEVEKLLQKAAIVPIHAKQTHIGFYSTLFLVKKKNRRSTSGDKFETPEQISCETSFQDGHSSKSFKPCARGRLGNFSRSERRLFSCSYTPRPSKIPAVLHSGSIIPISSHVLRSDTSSASVHKNCVGSCSTSTCEQHSAHCISRRLASGEQKQESTTIRSRKSAKSPHSVRFHSQCSKISINTYSEDSVLRQPFQSDIRLSVPYCRENSGSRIFNSRNEKESVGKCSTFSTSARHYGVVHRVDTICTTPYETCTTSPSSLLGSELERSRSHDTHYSTPQRSFKLVASASKHANGQIFTTMVYKQSANHRCIKDGVRSPHGRALFSRNLVGFGSQTAHKHIRVTGSAQSSSPFSSFVEGPEGTCSVRQCDSCTIFEQAGGTRSPTLCYRVWNLFLFAIQNQIELKAAHIAGKLNILADQLSRKRVHISPAEWTLNNQVVNQIFQTWGKRW